MPVLTCTKEFAAECAQRRIDYDRLFEPRISPQWLKRFEQQVLDECRLELSRLEDPQWTRIFEMRLEVMNAEWASADSDVIADRAT